MRVFSYKTHSHKYEPTQNDPRKDWKKLRLSGREWENSMEQIFILGSSYGGNQRFYKQKSQVLQINSLGHFKSSSRLLYKG